MRPIRQVLEDLLVASPALARRLRQGAVWPAWRETVGPEIADRAAPRRVQGTTLVIAVADSTWMQELTYLKPDILAKVQAIAGDAITDLRFELVHAPRA